MRHTKISVGIVCLIMSSSFAALAGGPMPVVNTSDSHAWTIYMNVNGALSSRTGKYNKNSSTDAKQNAWTLGGGVNVGIAGKLTNQVNAFAQLSVDQFATSAGQGYRFAAATNSKTTKDNTARLDKAYVNWNSADRSMVIQAGDMGILDMSTFTLSNLNAWRPNTMGFDINSVTDLFGPSRSNMFTNGYLAANAPLDTFNERGIAFGCHGFGHLNATLMYSVLPSSAINTATKNGFLGKDSANDLQAQLAWKTRHWVAAVTYLSQKFDTAGEKRDPSVNVQGAYRRGQLVFSGEYDRLPDNGVGGLKHTGFGAGASYNLDLFGFNHTFQFNWFNDDNGKYANKKSNSYQINDIVPIFNKHFNMIPFFITTDHYDGTDKDKNTQYGVLFQGLWSVNV